MEDVNGILYSIILYYTILGTHRAGHLSTHRAPKRWGGHRRGEPSHPCCLPRGPRGGASFLYTSDGKVSIDSSDGQLSRTDGHPGSYTVGTMKCLRPGDGQATSLDRCNSHLSKTETYIDHRRFIQIRKSVDFSKPTGSMPGPMVSMRAFLNSTLPHSPRLFVR
jgi:hypothetical protein